MNTQLRSFTATAILTADDQIFQATLHGKPGRGVGEVAAAAVHKLLDEQMPPNDFDEIQVTIRES